MPHTSSAFPRHSCTVPPWVTNYGTIRSITAPRCSTLCSPQRGKRFRASCGHPLIPLKASRKNRDSEIVSLDVRRERAMLLQQRGRTAGPVSGWPLTPQVRRVSEKFHLDGELEG